MALSIFSMAGKTVLVTGASSGLGKHMAMTLAKAGANVGLVARRQNQLNEIKSQIDAAGGKAHAVTLDVTDIGAIDGALSDVEKYLGPVQVLVNNAGLSMEGKALELTPEAYDTVLNVNTRGPFFMAQAVARRMVAAETGGSIINIASLISLKVRRETLPCCTYAQKPRICGLIIGEARVANTSGGEQSIDVRHE
jgi:NAD(P)-dependent dehydrogenase (short-subunit alcohol dehydrogenase family)